MGGQPSGLLCFENKLATGGGGGGVGGVGCKWVKQARRQLKLRQKETLIGNSLAAKLVVCLKYLQLFSNYLGKF